MGSLGFQVSSSEFELREDVMLTLKPNRVVTFIYSKMFDIPFYSLVPYILSLIHI